MSKKDKKSKKRRKPTDNDNYYSAEAWLERDIKRKNSPYQRLWKDMPNISNRKKKALVVASRCGDKMVELIKKSKETDSYVTIYYKHRKIAHVKNKDPWTEWKINTSIYNQFLGLDIEYFQKQKEDAIKQIITVCKEKGFKYDLKYLRSLNPDLVFHKLYCANTGFYKDLVPKKGRKEIIPGWVKDKRKNNSI